MGKVKNSKYPEAEAWYLDEYWYYRLSENLWWPLEVGSGGNLDPIYKKETQKNPSQNELKNQFFDSISTIS